MVLQSDAEVANDWLDRLAAHAAGPNVGVIGCFTNSVGAATYPLPQQANPIPHGQTVATLDALFARANPGGSVALPAVDGPCLYFRRECLSAVGALDSTPVGGDYGVEIDFCLRAGKRRFQSPACRRRVRRSRRARIARATAISWRPAPSRR